MQGYLEKIKTNIEPLRQQIIHHKVYSVIRTVEDLNVFMEHHVFAVWDFMSLLKSLQNKLTCTRVPWFPQGDADSRFLINEIVVGEESDIDSNGIRKSHFELYLDAMQQCGANTTQIATFLATLRNTGDLKAAFVAAGVPESVREFVGFTFRAIDSDLAHIQSAVFTFGREDLIPNMFLSIINDLDKRFPGNISVFKYYLERHIEVDGDHHSHLALQMTSNLCGTDAGRWEAAELAVIESLTMRIRLWDGVYNALTKERATIL